MIGAIITGGLKVEAYNLRSKRMEPFKEYRVVRMSNGRYRLTGTAKDGTKMSKFVSDKAAKSLLARQNKRR